MISKNQEDFTMERKVVRVLFNGDSTTDVGRARPIGDGFGKMGDSYLANIFCMTWADHPNNNIRYFNAAVSGDTTTKLLARFDEDVTPYKPDYVFFLIGINDCWRRYDCPLTPSSATTPEQYRQNMQTCIDKTKAIGAIPTLISPFFFELNKQDAMRHDCDECNDILRDLAANNGIDFIDVQSRIDWYLENGGNYCLLGNDRVHPSAVCKSLIAQYIYNHPAFRKIFNEQ